MLLHLGLSSSSWAKTGSITKIQSERMQWQEKTRDFIRLRTFRCRVYVLSKIEFKEKFNPKIEREKIRRCLHIKIYSKRRSNWISSKSENTCYPINLKVQISQ